MDLDEDRFCRDVMAALDPSVREIRLREMEACINAELARAATLREFQDLLYPLIEDIHHRLGHFLGRWEYDCEVESYGGMSYMDPSIPNELLLKSTFPHGAELRWGDFNFNNEEHVSTWANAQIPILDAGWVRLTAVLDRIGPAGVAQPLSPTWTVKEMLAHIAFWEETSLPVIECIYRGKPEIPAARWYGGDDLELAPGEPWPDADTHNAREARWARRHTNAEVLDRLARARRQLIAVITTVTDDEGRGEIGQQWSAVAVCGHVDRHLAKIKI